NKAYLILLTAIQYLLITTKIYGILKKAGMILLVSGGIVSAQTHTIFPEKNDILSDIDTQWDTAKIVQTITHAAGTNLSREQPNNAFSIMHETLTASKSLSFPYGIASSLYQLANAYTARSLYTEAESTYREAVPYCLNDGRAQRLLPM